MFSDVNLTNLLQEAPDSASFGLSDPVFKLEKTSTFPGPDNETVVKAKKVSIPSVRKKTLKCSCKSLGTFPVPFCDILNNKSLHESVNKHATLPLVDSISTSQESCNKCDAYFSSGTKFLEKNQSVKSFRDQTVLKNVKDLKDLMRNEETGDSLNVQDTALVVLREKSYCDNKDRFGGPGLVSDFGNLMLDSKISHQLNKKAENLENIPSFLKNKGSLQEYDSYPSRPGGSTFSAFESPSLADLLQEHQGSNLDKAYSLSDLCNESFTCFTDTDLVSSRQSQLNSQCQIPSGMTELSGSLSSLTFSRASPVRELESLSLSDLIAKSIELDKHHTTTKSSNLQAAKTMPPAVVNSDIDLSILLRKSTLSPEPTEIQSDTLSPQTQVLLSKEGHQLLAAKGSKKRKARFRLCSFGGAGSWTKVLSARPSAFAMTLCLHYPPKRYYRQTVGLHKAFLYSRQIQDEKINEIGPLTVITPFDFKSPSPDDIVKASQKKAFTR